MGLLEEEDTEDLDESSGDASTPKDTSPRRVFGNETSGNRSNSGAKSWGEAVDTKCFSALIMMPAIPG